MVRKSGVGAPAFALTPAESIGEGEGPSHFYPPHASLSFRSLHFSLFNFFFFNFSNLFLYFLPIFAFLEFKVFCFLT